MAYRFEVAEAHGDGVGLAGEGALEYGSFRKNSKGNRLVDSSAREAAKTVTIERVYGDLSCLVLVPRMEVQNRVQFF